MGGEIWKERLRSKKGEGEEDITVRVGRAHSESRQCSVGVGYRCWGWGQIWGSLYGVSDSGCYESQGYLSRWGGGLVVELCIWSPGWDFRQCWEVWWVVLLTGKWSSGGSGDLLGVLDWAPCDSRWCGVVGSWYSQRLGSEYEQFTWLCVLAWCCMEWLSWLLSRSFVRCMVFPLDAQFLGSLRSLILLGMVFVVPLQCCPVTLQWNIKWLWWFLTCMLSSWGKCFASMVFGKRRRLSGIRYARRVMKWS